MPRSSLYDLLYLDEARVNFYLGQWKKLEELVKTAEWKAGLSITGPVAEGTQSEAWRTRLLADRLDTILSELSKHGPDVLRTTRPEPLHVGELPPFVIETCTAQQVVVPASPGSHGREIVFWVSDPGQVRTTLCLLENPAPTDRVPYNAWDRISVYSLLASLIAHTREQNPESVLSAAVPHIPHPNAYASFERFPSNVEWVSVQEHARYFLTNPADLLAQWGCTVLPPRSIETLYLIREGGIDHMGKSLHGEDARLSIFGYPLWIRRQLL